MQTEMEQQIAAILFLYYARTFFGETMNFLVNSYAVAPVQPQAVLDPVLDHVLVIGFLILVPI
jgi:hypothetical protein